jgi:hemolysin III
MDRKTADITHTTRRFSHGEEIVNSLLHGTGIILSLAGLIYLVWRAGHVGGLLLFFAVVIYSLSLVTLYGASTLYHALSETRARRFFKVVDHGAIYVLIAGSCTPFALLVIGGSMGWVLFGVAWAIALGGIVNEIFWGGRPRWLSVLVYVGISFLIVGATTPMLLNLSPGGLLLLGLAGTCYLLGTPFYIFKRFPYFHAVWHVFVLLGSILHWCAVLLYVIPGKF